MPIRKLKLYNTIHRDFPRWVKNKYNNVITKYYDFLTIEKVISLLLKKTRYYIINNPAGVYLEGIGYFFVFYHLRRKKIVAATSNILYKARRWHVTFIPQWDGSLRYFSFDYEFNKELKNKIKKQLDRGFRYTTYADSFNVKR